MADATKGGEAAWERRFRVPTVLGAGVARRRPERGLAVANPAGRYQLHAWDVASGDLRPLTDTPDGELDGVLAPDGSQALYLDDEAGNEVGHLVRVPFAGGPPVDLTPGLPPYGWFGAAYADDGRTLVAAVVVDGEHRLLAIDLPDGPSGAAGEPRVVHRSPALFSGPSVAPDGSVAVVPTTERTGRPQTTLLAVELADGEVVGELADGDEASVENGPFAPVGPPWMAGTSDASGFRRPFLWQPRTGERRGLPVDLAGDVVPADWSADAAELLLVQTHEGRQSLHRHHLPSGRTARVPLPDGSLGSATFGPAGEVLATWEDAAEPGRVLAVADGAVRVALAAGDAPPGHAFRSVRFASADGTPLQGWLGVPAGAGPFPTILSTHGGPQAADTNGFSPEAQAWLDHGFAVLSLNYRGSTTFGRAFEQQIWGRLGELELADMVAARDWLVQTGIARPDLVFPSGWSYGGFLTLYALGRRPDLWAGGLAGVAVADWTMLWEDSGDFLRGYCTAIFEGTPAERPEPYRASSPLTYVDDVAAPVLVIQGRNDTRTPARPVEVYVKRLRARGAPVEIEWFDSGHLGSFGDADRAIAHMARFLEFAKGIVGGHGG